MKNPKAKGNQAERDVVNALRSALKADPTQLFRTPASGGNKYMERSDVTIKAPLLYRFPFSIECKHVCDWNPGRMYKPRKDKESAWLDQTMDACKENNKLVDDVLFVPMQILRGNGVPAWVYMGISWTDKKGQTHGLFDKGIHPLFNAMCLNPESMSYTMKSLKYGMTKWIGVPFEDFCNLIQRVEIDGKTE
jgi:hypothetical protein